MTSDKNRLLWQARRGILELDLIFRDFIECKYYNLPLNLQHDFKELLQERDQDLYNWLIGSEDTVNNKYKDIIHEIRSKHY